MVLAKAVLLVCVGVPLVLLVAASTAVLIRRATGTELQPFPLHHEVIRFSAAHFAAWGARVAGAEAAWHCMWCVCLVHKCHVGGCMRV